MTQHIPHKFSRLLIRILVPFKAHCQLYTNEEITVNGGKSVKDSRGLADYFSLVLCKMGYLCTFTDNRVINMVDTVDFYRNLNLNQLSVAFNASFSPEPFPGL